MSKEESTEGQHGNEHKWIVIFLRGSTIPSNLWMLP